MTPAEVKALLQLRSTPGILQFSKEQIDLENGIIRDVVMVQEGEAKGHGLHLDAQFISDLVSYDQKVFGAEGVRVRFDHPSRSSMGSQLARMKNVRKRKGPEGQMQAIADMYLLESAKISPTHGDMHSWVLKMAQEDPGFIMSSIVFSSTGYFQKKANGQKKPIWDYDEEGNWMSYDSKLGAVYVTLGEHLFTDLVDDGAATSSMFKPSLEPAIELDSAPKPKNQMTLLELLFGKKAVTEPVELSAEEATELRQKLSLAETELAKFKAEADKATADLALSKTALDKAEADLATAQTKIAELSKAAADHTEGSSENPEPEKQKSFKTDPITAKAQEAFNRRKKA